MKEHLIIFYDGNCPLCVLEMHELHRINHQHNLEFVNIHIDNFHAKWPLVDKVQALKNIHGNLNGEIITGLDVTYHAWRLVNKHHRVGWIRWPFIKHIADSAYLTFAKYRHRISKALSLFQD